MTPFLKNIAPCLIALLAVSCASTLGRFTCLQLPCPPPKLAGFEVEVFRQGAPDRPFDRIARVDVHLEKTGFAGSSLEDALPELKKQARLSGADALIEIRETTSTHAETRIYHVTATGIRYKDTR